MFFCFMFTQFTVALLFIHIWKYSRCYALSFAEEDRRFLELGIIPSYVKRYKTAFGEVEEVNDLANDVDRFFEGDMELNKQDEVQLQGLLKRSIFEHNNELWSKSKQDGLVYIPIVYEPGIINIGDETKNALQDVFKFFEEQTCIRFKEEPSSQSPLTIYKGDGCHATIGKHDNGSLLSLGEGCGGRTTDIKHMLMHVLGFFHEQSRMDRDKYVMVRTDNIQPGKEKYFAKYQNGKVMTFPYDKKSIMHFSSNTFARSPNVQSIISLMDPTEELGGSDLSSLDIEKINRLYECTNYKDKIGIKKDVVKTGIINGDLDRQSISSKDVINSTSSTISSNDANGSNEMNSTTDVLNRNSNKQFRNGTILIESALHQKNKGHVYVQDNPINEIISVNKIDKEKVIHNFESDMDVDKGEMDERNDETTRRMVIQDKRRLWSKDWRGLVNVPYTYATGAFAISEDLKQTIEKIFTVFRNKTCIRFREWPLAPDAITIVRDQADGCRSKIGRHRNGGEIKLGKGCEEPAIIRHEVLHALGFLHEHQRPNRDDFVKILLQNIEKGKEKEFKIPRSKFSLFLTDLIPNTDTPFPYDKQSIMHYHSTAFSKDPKKLATVISLENPEEKLGNTEYTFLDMIKVNLFYNCDNFPDQHWLNSFLAGTSETSKEDDDGGGHRFG